MTVILIGKYQRKDSLYCHSEAGKKSHTINKFFTRRLTGIWIILYLKTFKGGAQQLIFSVKKCKIINCYE
jgi:hypothetical protein